MDTEGLTDPAPGRFGARDAAQERNMVAGRRMNEA